MFINQKIKSCNLTAEKLGVIYSVQIHLGFINAVVIVWVCGLNGASSNQVDHVVFVTKFAHKV